MVEISRPWDHRDEWSNMFIEKFKSTRPCRQDWGPQLVLQIAWKMFDNLPEHVRIVILAGQVKNKKVVCIENEEIFLEEKDILRNFIWVKSACEIINYTVPSKYLLADSFVCLNGILEYKLFQVPQEGGISNEKKTEIVLTAGIENGRCLQLCIQKLRTLFRNTQGRAVANSARIRELKSLLVRTPKKGQMSLSSEASTAPESSQASETATGGDLDWDGWLVDVGKQIASSNVGS